MLSSVCDAFLLIFGRGLLLYKSHFVSATSFNMLLQVLLQLALLAKVISDILFAFRNAGFGQGFVWDPLASYIL